MLHLYRRICSGPSKPCRSEACKTEATRFLEIMDLSVDPCEDFGQFVCGKFYKNDTYPENARLAVDFARNNRE